MLAERGREKPWSNRLCIAVYPKQILLTKEWWTLAAQSGQLSDTCVGSFSKLLKDKLPNCDERIPMSIILRAYLLLGPSRLTL